MPGHNTTLGGGGFHHVAIRTRDYDKSLAFYTETLGFTQRIEWGDAPKRATMLDTGDGNYLEIFERPEQQWADEGPCILHFALRTSDVDAAVARCRDAGCPVTMEPNALTIQGRPEPVDVKIAFVKGPDGEVIEFFESAGL